MTCWRAVLAMFALAAPACAQAGHCLAGEPTLYYETLGTRGPLVVVVHGGPGIPHDYLRPEWDRLADGARVVYYDQRGCGRSGRMPPFGWRDHVLDLDRLLVALSPTAPVVLAGSSWGTVLAVYYAALHPGRVRALVLSGVPAIIRAGGTPLDARWLATVPVARWDSVNRGLPVGFDSTPRLGLDPRLAPRVKESCGDVHGIINVSQTDAPRFEDFDQIAIPTLVLRGGDAANLGDDAGADLARQLQRARLVTVPDAGHDPWLDRPDAFFREVRAFLGQMPTSAGAGPPR